MKQRKDDAYSFLRDMEAIEHQKWCQVAQFYAPHGTAKLSTVTLDGSSGLSDGRWEALAD